MGEPTRLTSPDRVVFEGASYTKRDVVEYYRRRAAGEVGLIITEGTTVNHKAASSDTGIPNFHSDDALAGWARVVEALHAEGGRIAPQLWHVGPLWGANARFDKPARDQLMAMHPMRPSGRWGTPGVTNYSERSVARWSPEVPPMTDGDISDVIDGFARSARLAMEAGFDGVELHGANGYLIQQFLAPNANERSDRYGGRIGNRIRFALEVASAVSEAIGPGRTGIRISPGSTLGGIDEGPEGPALYRHLVPALAELGLAYLHVAHGGNEELLGEIRRLWPNALLVARPNRPLEKAAADVEAGLADMAPVGRWALANPDFVDRFRYAAPLNEPDPATFYGGGATGYTDYPTLGRSVAAA